MIGLLKALAVLLPVLGLLWQSREASVQTAAAATAREGERNALAVAKANGDALKREREESERRIRALAAAQDASNAAAESLAAAESRNASLQEELSHAAAVADGRPCLDAGLVRRLRDIGATDAKRVR